MKLSKFNIIKKYSDKILVYNSFTKASLFLETDSDTSIFEDISLFEKLNDEEKKLLISNGFIIDDNRDEIKEIEYMFEKKYYDSSFHNIILVPTLGCNFNCPYCFEKEHTCGKENFKEYFKTLRKYAEKYFKQHNVIQISLFGGEPLLYIKEAISFLEWVEKDAKKNNYHYFVSIVTNGSLLTKEILNSLLKHNLYTLQITLDSDKETHDKTRIFKNGKPSFDILVKNINELIPLTIDNENFKFILRINLNNTTVEKVKDSLKCINENIRPHIHLLIRAIYNTKAYKKGNTNSINELQPYFTVGKELGFKIVRDKYNYQTCEACGDTKGFYLMPDLTMWKCINNLDYKQCCIGKITETGDPKLIPENLVNWHEYCHSAFNDKECLKCKKLPDCLGGCPLLKCKNNKKQCRSFDMACLPYIMWE